MIKRYLAYFVAVVSVLFGVVGSVSAELILHFDMEQDSTPLVDQVSGVMATAVDGGHLYGLAGPEGFGLAAGLEDNGAWQLDVDDSEVFREFANDFSVATWIYLDSDIIADKADLAEPNFALNRFFGDDVAWDADGWGMGVWEDGRVRFTKNGVVDLDTADSWVELDTWVHLAATVSSDDGVAIYVDGEEAEFFDDIRDLNNGVGNNGEDDVFGVGRTYGALEGQWVGGRFDEIRVYDHVLTPDEVLALTVPGEDDPLAKLDDGSLTDPTERANYVHDVLGTWIGDSNLDGEFSSTDFVFVFTAGQYEDGVEGNSTWVTGDWNGDGDFDSSDFVAAFTDGGFENGPRAAAAAVPEPSSSVLLLFGFLLPMLRRRA